MGRPIWKGSINFGLVSIAMQLETAVKEKTVRFHMLTKEGTCRLRQKLYCPDTKKEYDFGETARGIEVAPGQYALVEKRGDCQRSKPQQQGTRSRSSSLWNSMKSIRFISMRFISWCRLRERSVKAYEIAARRHPGASPHRLGTLCHA